MEEKLNQLKEKLAQVYDLQQASALLGWDQETYMPPGGAQGRAHQTATLSSMAHSIFTGDEVGKLFEELQDWAAGLDFASDEAAIIRVGKRYYDQQIKVPSELVNKLSETSSLALQAWRKAREDDDFAAFLPHLEKTLELQLQYAEYLGYESNPYDALVDQYDSGLDYAQIAAVFTPLKPELIALVQSIVANKDAVDDSIMRKGYPEAEQMQLSQEIAKALGFDFERGRLDLSTHPFTTSFSQDDVRITTRVYEDYLPTCITGTVHETGHALYELGSSPALYRIGFYPSALSGGSSMSIHESQSRFYENVLGRSRAFWQHFFPRAQELFPEQLGNETLEAFYRGMNKSEPSFIRVDADEVTYGLHIMLRFELENDLVNGRIKVADLPQEWNARFEDYLGIVPPNNTQGVLQDIHWSMGLLGYFPDYLLGSIFAVQLWKKMQEDIPNALDQVAQGQFTDILNWKNEHIHRHGNKFTFPETAERVTGGPLAWEPYLNYLKSKFGEIYGL